MARGGICGGGIVTSADIKDPVLKDVIRTADGRPWVQRCYVCNKQVNFIKLRPHQWVNVGEFVRHTRCYPPPLR